MPAHIRTYWSPIVTTTRKVILSSFLCVLCGSIRSNLVSFLCVICVICGSVRGSGAYDHGTATGRGKLELDFTWNPFGIFKDGQTYVVVGYGLSDRLDFHGYFAHHEASGLDNYYYGLFYQFLRTKRLDLSTAVGIRRYPKRETVHAFFPQLLYNIKIGAGLTIGGSIVDIRTIKEDTAGHRGTSFDMALFLPITKYFPVPGFVEEIKVGIGIFRPGTYQPIAREFLPTYSLDVKFNPKSRDINQKKLLSGFSHLGFLRRLIDYWDP